MKRVLFVDHVSRILGGAEINLIELLAEPPDDWDVLCACPPESRLASALRANGVRCCDYELAGALNELRVVERGDGGVQRGVPAALRDAVRRLSVITAGFEPDCAISCTNKDHLVSGWACRRAGIPSLWWHNDALTPDFFPWKARAAFRAAARLFATRVITVSEFARRALLMHGFPASQAVVIHNGIPLERYQNAGGHLRGLPEFAGAGRIVGMVGRFAPWKGQAFFLQLAEAMAGDFPDVHFALVGQAFNEDQAFEAELRQFVDAHDLGSRVHFVPFQDNVAGVLSDLDVLAHASLKPEPFGRVIIEAMAAGVPVLAARAGGVTEIIMEGMNGLLAAPGDLAGYRRQLAALLRNPDDAARLRDEALRTVSQCFTVERVRRAFDRLVTEVHR